MSFVYSPALIRVAGPEAAAFLDNLLTRNLADLAPGGLAYAGLLTPQGKVAFDFFAWRDMDGAFVLEPAPARRDALRQRLALYRLRAKVEIGDDPRGLQGLIAFAPPPAAPDGVLSAPDPRQPGFGWRALGTAADIAALATQMAPALTENDVRARRIAAGAPDLAEDSGPEEFFALEALFEEFGAVDFHKGCFIGQENVSRMKRR
ncbi:MAG: folate-binding protein, partial [Alphaproteobacteria bacterium]|nr:folate-binding protein [Alphaproteobacteria bacterium]